MNRKSRISSHKINCNIFTVSGFRFSGDETRMINVAYLDGKLNLLWLQ